MNEAQVFNIICNVIDKTHMLFFVILLMIFWVNNDSGFKHLRPTPFFIVTLFRHITMLFKEKID